MSDEYKLPYINMNINIRDYQVFMFEINTKLMSGHPYS
jgi:hypothetical protein